MFNEISIGMPCDAKKYFYFYENKIRITDLQLVIIILCNFIKRMPFKNKKFDRLKQNKIVNQKNLSRQALDHWHHRLIKKTTK
jgi:hypothetical protein